MNRKIYIIRKNRFPNIYKIRRGFGTLEIVIIIAVLLTVALIFRHALIRFANHLIDIVFNEESVIEEMTMANDL